MILADLTVRAAKKAESKREFFSVSLVGSPAKPLTQTVSPRRNNNTSGHVYTVFGDTHMEIREYQSSDRHACLNIMQSNIPEYFHERDLVDFAVFLENLPGPFFVMMDPQGGLIACGSIALGRTTPIEAVLCYGMVTGTRLHQGIGLELLRKRLEFFLPREPQVERIVVNTTQKTEGFFRKFGFSVVERELDGLGSGLDRVSMMVIKDNVLRLLNERILNRYLKVYDFKC